MASTVTHQATIAPAEGSLRELQQLREENAQLARAVNQSRDINVVVGILMERFKLDRQRAFEALRQQARARRIKLEELALALLGAEEQLQCFAMHRPAGVAGCAVALPVAGKASDNADDH
jgi:AmiR/NasT family two-component response regulator